MRIKKNGLLKYILTNKLFWIVIISTLLIHLVVKANKDQSSKLMDEYYSQYTSDTTMITEEAESMMSKQDSMLIFAESLLGMGYKYGMTGPNLFDCSGYVYYVFKNFDVKLSRSTKYQSKDGEFIPKDSIRSGDLVFFKSPSRNNPNVGHVGIVLENKDGNVKFIHSSTGRGVVIDSLGSHHYGRRFMEARRVNFN